MLKHTFFLSLFWFCSASTNSSSSKLGKFAGAEYKGHPHDSETCFLKGACQPIENSTCFGTSLPYTHFSADLATDSTSFFEAQGNSTLLQRFHSLPGCWTAIKTLLCAVYMPKCENDSISLPSQEMCHITKGPCKTVAEEQGWPNFLLCDNKTLFPSGCKNPLQGIIFNSSSKCSSPLVKTDNPNNWFHGVPGCGVQCRNLLYNEEDHFIAHCFIFLTVLLSFIRAAGSVVHSLIGWKELNNYCNKVKLYINLCMFSASFGWMAQFAPGGRESIACMDDGTVRLQHGSDPSLCSMDFVMIYFFSMSAVAWFVILTYVWYSGFPKKGSQKDSVQLGKYFFAICAWLIPLVLTEIARKTSKLEGDSLSGICSIGLSDIYKRFTFLLVPAFIAILLAFNFLAQFLFNIFKKMSKVTKEQARRKLSHILLNRGLITLLIFILYFIVFSCQAYDFINGKEWDESFRNYVNCLAKNSSHSSLSSGESSYSECELKSWPRVNRLIGHLICILLFNLVMILASVDLKKSSILGDRTDRPLRSSRVVSRPMKSQEMIKVTYRDMDLVEHRILVPRNDNREIILDGRTIPSRNHLTSISDVLCLQEIGYPGQFRPGCLCNEFNNQFVPPFQHNMDLTQTSKC